MDEASETKYTHEETTNWSKMRAYTNKILKNIQKKPGEFGDLLHVNFQTKEYLKTSGIESQFLEQGKLV